MSRAEKTVLAAQNIALSYYQKGQLTPVLANVSLTLKAGEILAILGFSGSGKSSLLRILAGLKKPQHGQVYVHGETCQGPHPQIGFMFQDPCLLPWLNLEANVEFGIRLKNQKHVSKRERKARVEAILQEVGLSHAAHSYPASLSGGMAQRGSLARSLVRQPDVLLLDEPFSALDAVTRAEMQQLLLQTTKNHNTAAVLVTHDIDEALEVADRIILLGGSPSYVVKTWELSPHIAGEPCELRTRIHEDIVRTLRQDKDATDTTPATSQLLAIPA